MTTPNPVAAPSGLTASAISSAEVDLGWTNNATNADSVRIERKVGSGGTYVEIATLGPTTPSFADTEVTQGTTFYYRVRAYSSTLGSSAYSNEANAPVPVPPAAPTNLTATAVPGLKINLAWTDNSNNETGFKIERKATSTGTYLQITTVGQNIHSYADQDTELQSGTTYYYRVRAYNTTLGNSAYTNEAGATAVPNPAPHINQISPNTGANLGGTPVTITGTSFLPSPTVTIGGVALSGIGVSPDGTTITGITGAHANGVVDVLVTNTDSQSVTLAGGFTYTNPPPPQVIQVTPASGPVGGGASVVITGTGFLSNPTVKFDTALATVVSVNPNGTSISATTPGHSAGLVSVTVTNTDGQSNTLATAYTYTSAPVVNSVSPAQGTTAGGTGVTVTGTGFVAGATVKFGSNSATNVSVAANGLSLTANTPGAAGPGLVSVTVINPDTQSGVLPNGFNYQNPAPTLTQVSPSSGPSGGGTAVVITGSGFLANPTVTIGGIAATGIQLVSGSQINATTAAHPSTTADVTVTNNDGQSATLTGGFTYVLLEDFFGGTSVDTSKWVNNSLLSGAGNASIQVKEQNGGLSIGPLLSGVAGNNYNGIKSGATYDFTGAYAYIQVTQTPNSTAHGEAVLTVGSNQDNWYAIKIKGTGTGLNVLCVKDIAKTITTVNTTAYNSTNHQFLRIRHDSASGNVVFEAAPNNSGKPGAWTTLYSEAWNSSVNKTSSIFEIKAGTTQSESSAPGTAIFDNFRAAKP